MERVTPELIKMIIKEKIKSGKNDPEEDMTTDNLKNAPYSLYVHQQSSSKGFSFMGSSMLLF